MEQAEAKNVSELRVTLKAFSVLGMEAEQSK